MAIRSVKLAVEKEGRSGPSDFLHNKSEPHMQPRRYIADISNISPIYRRYFRYIGDISPRKKPENFPRARVSQPSIYRPIFRSESDISPKYRRHFPIFLDFSCKRFSVLKIASIKADIQYIADISEISILANYTPYQDPSWSDDKRE